MATIDSENKQINFTEYSPAMFVQMMAWVRERMANCAPLTVHRGGYIYVFKTEDDKNQYESLIDTNPTAAAALIYDSWKEGGSAIINVNILSGYTNRILLGSTGNKLRFSWETTGGTVSHEAVTVNFTVECNGATETWQETYSYYDNDGKQRIIEVTLDDYLSTGRNTVTIQVTGSQSKVVQTEEVTYVVSELSVDSDFDIAKLYAVGENVGFNVVAKGSPDDGTDMVVEYCYDGTVMSALEQKVISSNIGRSLEQSLALAPTKGKHTLQMRAKATIGGDVKYSYVLYYEFVANGTSGRQICISRTLDQTDFLGSSSSLTIKCKQYVTTSVAYAFYSSSSGDKVSLTWLLKDTSGSSSSVGNTTLGEDSAINDGVVRSVDFVPVESGTFTLGAYIYDADGNEGDAIASYDVSVEYNSNIQATTRSLQLRLNATGRSNTEDSSVRSTWTYKSISAVLTGMLWNQRNGWYQNALCLLGGKLSIPIAPFSGMGVTTASVSIEIDFETFANSNDNAVVFHIGNIIKILPNCAYFYSNSGANYIVDKFPTGTRMKLAFVAHAKSGTTETEPGLMEIINGGISSRLRAYNSESFASSATIEAGGTTEAGIKIHSLLVYSTAISTEEELNNVITSSDDITRMISNNDIYTDGSPDVTKISDKVPCLLITGKGGSNVLQTIWDYTDETNRPVIHVDAEWRNPDYPETNFTIKNMRARGHGQSTMRNPMKSIKVWLKDDDEDSQYDTTFFPQGVEDTSEDHLWAMTPDSHPINKLVFQCYYVDSSSSKSPAILSLYNDVCKAAGILTPSQKYARDTYPGVMGVSSFPYDLRIAPESIPAYILSRDDENSAWKIEGIFVLMSDKKADYLYGERSIYNCPSDPFCYRHDKDAYSALWDNSLVTRIEFKSNNHPIAAMTDSDYIEENYYGEPKTLTEDEDDPTAGSTDTEGTSSLTEGGDSSGSNSATNYDSEQAVEIIYPDYDDFYKKNGTFNLDKYKKHMTKHKNLALWVAKCWENGGASSAVFRAEASQHLDLELWAVYYIFFRTFGAFDSPVRNMQLTTMSTAEGTADANNVWGGSLVFEIWFPMPWDWDIAMGTINTGPLAFDPPVDRQTENSYGVAFRGQNNALWNMLENWTYFKNLVSTTLDKLYQAGFTFANVVAYLKKYSDRWSETMYNESENTKYKQMYLSNPSKYADFLSYNLGRGLEFMEWWFKVNFDSFCAEFAGGSFTSSGINWRGNNDYPTNSVGFTVAYDRSTHFGWAIGNDKQVTSNGQYSLAVSANEDVNISIARSVSNSEYTTIYNAPYIKRLDISKFGYQLGNLNLGAFVDEQIGTMLEEFSFGVPDGTLTSGVRNTAGEISVVGIESLTSLIKLQMQGFRNYSNVFDLRLLSALTHLYCKGSGFTNIYLPESATMEVAELPSSLIYLTLNKTTIDSLKFFDPDTLAEYTFPHALRYASFTGLGSNDVVKQLVLDWLAYNDNRGTLSQCSLEIYSVDWRGLSYDDILRIGKVGTLQITGYLQMERDTAFTSTEMTSLIETYPSDYDIFNSSAAFYIGCTAQGFSIGVSGDAYWDDTLTNSKGEAGVWCILAGNSCQFRAVSFGASGASTSMLWNIQSGSLSGSKYTYRTAEVTIATGAIASEETGIDTYVMTLNVTDGTTSDSIDLCVVKRKYPTAVRINPVNADGTDAELLGGKLNISNGGIYNFEALFTVDGAVDKAFVAGSKQYGHFKQTDGYKWTYSDTDANRSAVTSQSAYALALRVYDTPDDDTEFVLTYWAQFMNNAGKVTATPFSILMFSLLHIISNVGDSFGGNQALFAVLAALKDSDGSTALLSLSDGYYTNEELKRVVGELTIASGSGVTRFTVTSLKDNADYNVLSYLTNVTSLVCTNLATLEGDIDITRMSALQHLDLSGTSTQNVGGISDKPYLTSVKFHAPTSLTITNCNNLNISE